MPRLLAALLAIALVVVTAGGPAGAVSDRPDAVSGFELAQQFDRTQFRLVVHPNGSARWTFHYERTLANESERQQFESFAATFNANETTLYTDFRNQSRTLVSQGENVTGREMAAEGFTRRAFVTTQLNDVGVVEMAFTWTGFAPVEGDRVIVGDVFEGGLYIGTDQSLVVRAAGGLAFRSVEPPGTLSGSTLSTSDTVTWTGERTFTDNRPRVVLAPAAADPGTTASDGAGVTTTSGSGPTTATTEPSSPVWPVALVLLVIAAAIGVFLHRRRGSGAGSGGEPSADGASVDETALIDDEARVEDLLREHGGRLRQSAIVEATGWSKSKVSMVLSEMEEADQVRKLRVGRENIVSLPGHEPDAAGSPHDDEGGES